MGNWHNLTAAEVLLQLGSSPAGISPAEVEQRLAQYGCNELPERSGEHPWQILLKQLTSSMMLILLIATLISVILGDYGDAAAILAIVIFNTALGFRQEYQAGQAIAALRQLTVPVVRVRRQGRVQPCSARELVPGDLVLLQAGNRVPADCRLIETVQLRLQEGSLTGESEPVDKTSTPLDPEEMPLAERKNMAYMGSIVSSGRGVGVITATGIDTELGQIATTIQSMQIKTTPLQQRLDQLGWILGGVITLICAGVFLLGVMRGESWKLMFLESVSLAVAAVPEGLPAVVTIALALGAQRMFRQQALIRNLPAVETLGSVTVICSDKTGTLTQGQMSVAEIITPQQQVDLRKLPAEGTALVWPDLALLLLAAALCNNAQLLPQSADPPFTTLGDPTETALVQASAHLGLWKTDLEHAFPRLAEIPFDAEHKRMITLHRLQNGTVDLPHGIQQWHTHFLQGSTLALAKGAPEFLLANCTQMWQDDQVRDLDLNERQIWNHHSERLAQSGRRVLALACQVLPPTAPLNLAGCSDHPWVLLGLMGLIDPPRPQVAEAVRTCQQAGIRPLMISGDHPLTAQAIAAEVGIASLQDPILTGSDLDKASPDQLANWVNQVSIYSRMTPQHKYQIVQALQEQGQIVAMTGDGINDAPALKQADIGIAMGINGTDVAKEAADMVLLDDDFATIVAATREGRVITDNIRKFIRYTLTGNLGELWLILVAPFLGMPLPLLPLQILWINLLADGILAVALSVEPAEQSAMARPPHPPHESVFSRGLGWGIAWIGSLLGALLLISADIGWSQGYSHWQSVAFSALLLSRVGLVLTMRSEQDSCLQLNPNPALAIAVPVTCSLHLLILTLPWLRSLFQVDLLSGREILWCIAVGLIMMACVEVEKRLKRKS